MENIYLILVIVLFILAISDLVVGVSNDAGNFLQSAIGSKAASFKIIVFIASIGVLIGAGFSGGMMEIARNGILNPEMFVFTEVMLIFLAVMVTDVILLDTFNGLGLPTSTTVSIVFELLGASVGMALIKMSGDPDSLTIGAYINTGKALAIIAGILLSVVIAFSFGAIIQYITRAIFSFRYEKRFRLFGGLFSGIAITTIIYFIFIKGAKDATFISKNTILWINSNRLWIILVSLVGSTVLLQLLHSFFKVNTLKIVVLSGTFALAMAFAGNDLVNFLGVPLAGLDSYQTLISQPGIPPDSLVMHSLKGAVQTNPIILLLAGVIMVIALYTSRRAQTVIKTAIDLGRQDEGEERFGSNPFSRATVRLSINLSEKIRNIIPEHLQERVAKQFEAIPKSQAEKDAPAFDLLRASVNLVVASALIALGTSLKLPLSTTYVTFMVAMGSSLSDGAWDRESAVYRVTGVFSVIGGWFFTAFSAFIIAFGIVFLLYYAGLWAIAPLVLLSFFLMYRTQKSIQNKELLQLDAVKETDEINSENIFQSSSNAVIEILNQVQLEYKMIVRGLSEQSIRSLKATRNNIEDLSQKSKEKKKSVTTIITKLKEDAVESGHFYVQSLDYLREILHCLNFIIQPVYDHVNNNHKPLSEAQLSEMRVLARNMGVFFTHITTEINEGRFINQDNVATEQQKILSIVDLFRKNEVKRIKKDAGSTRNSLLFMNFLQETKSLLLFTFNLYKAQRDFLNYYESKKL
ncbi:MAG: inorganic phosphate transporter [Bacteroidales bacterium]|nr:inorganic phosphate transporter [Bacteroidales bacterium]MDD3702401.1 inorganic phosphate transporter [Bacteroidales bacterium]MDY0369190.1 inorganic phosphate transporter [Bacteroidales bacterium]